MSLRGSSRLVLSAAGLAAGAFVWAASAWLQLTTVGAIGTPLFEAESICLDVSDRGVSLEATYDYRNPGDLPMLCALYTPLPAPRPVELRLWRQREAGQRPVPYVRLGDCLYWLIRLEPASVARIGLSYRQTPVLRQARYILTSTWSWGRPIPSASFAVRAPAAWRPVLSGIPVEMPAVASAEGSHSRRDTLASRAEPASLAGLGARPAGRSGSSSDTQQVWSAHLRDFWPREDLTVTYAGP